MYDSERIYESSSIYNNLSIDENIYGTFVNTHEEHEDIYSSVIACTQVTAEIRGMIKLPL